MGNATKRRIGTILMVLAAVILLSVLALIYVLKTNRALGTTLNFEDYLKLSVYENMDSTMGIYLEDKSAGNAARLSYNIVKESANANELVITDEDATLINNQLIENFRTFLEGDYVITDGMGNMSELTKSYVANLVASSVFQIKPELRDEMVVKDSYLTFDNTISNSVEINKLRKLVKELDEEVDSIPKETVDYTEAIAEVSVNMDAIETLIMSMENRLVTVETAGEAMQDQGYLTENDLIAHDAQVLAKLDSITEVEARITNLVSDNASIKEEANAEILKMQETFVDYTTQLSELKQEIIKQYTTNENYTSQISDITAELLIAKQELYSEINNVNSQNQASINVLQNTIAVNQESVLTQIQNNQNLINGQLASTKTELSNSIAGTKQELNSSISSTKQELNNSISSTKSELNTSITNTANTAQSNLEAARTALQSSISDTNTALSAAVSSLTGRIDALEAMFYTTSATTSNLLQTIITQANMLTAAELYTTFNSEVSELEAQLNELKADLVNEKNTLGTSTEAEEKKVEIDNIIAEINTELQDISDYKTSMNDRIQSLDDSILAARDNIAEMDDETKQMLITISTELISIQNAEKAYMNAITKKVSEITREVQKVSKDTEILNTSENLNELVETVKEEILGQIEDLSDEVTDIINDVIGSASDPNSISGQIAALEQRHTVTRIDSITLATTAWETSGTGVKVRINNEAFEESSHVQVIYQGTPGINPTYSGGDGYIEIHLAYTPSETIVIDAILVYNKATTE